MTAEKRSALMAKIRGKDTKPELAIAEGLKHLGLRFRRHVVDLPGRPDIVFPEARMAVFVDGDFWHGWRFQLWRAKLSPKWAAKIEANRQRDQRNFRKLRRTGWRVLRIWEHQVEADVAHCVGRIAGYVRLAESLTEHAGTRTSK